MPVGIHKWTRPEHRFNTTDKLVLFGAEGYYRGNMEASKKKILLVEDDTALAAVYRSRLELEGFEINEVNNGEDALSAAMSFKPDLILLDAMMPKISGFDVLDILRNTPDTTNIRVIMLTALSQPKDKERAEQLGVDDYLVKSQVVISDVVARVKFHLDIL